MHALQDQAVRIQISDLQNNRVNQVEVGVPFLVQVTIQNVDSDQQPQGFDAWTNFAITLYGQSHATRSINGKLSQSVTLTYIATPEQKGTFLCPALSVTDSNGTVISSDVIKIVVGDAVQVSHQISKQPYVLQIDVDACSVFVGQKVTATLRFGYQEQFSDLRITETPMQNIYRGYVSQEAVSGKFKIGAQEYSSQDFMMELYPEKVGMLVIPAFQASFAPQRSQSIASMFSIVMGGGNVVQSQPRSLEVKALPENTEFKNVTAIGQFESVEFKLSTQHAAVGEGVVAKMIVVGDGNLEVVKAPELEMPQGLHYYEGNSNVTREKNGTFKKEFEWIVQAEHADSFEISAQKFVYFDLKDQVYKVLKSAPCKIVMNGHAKKATQMTESEPLTKISENTEIKKEQPKAESVVQSWFDYVKMTDAFSSNMMTWFIKLLIGVIALLAIVLLSRRYLSDLFFLETLKFRWQFLAYCKNKDIHGVYRLFEIVMQKYGLSMQGQDLQQCFIDLKMPDEAFENWKNFVTMIWEMNFAKDRASDQTELAFSLAKQWFAIILSCCKLQKKKLRL